MIVHEYRCAVGSCKQRSHLRGCYPLSVSVARHCPSRRRWFTPRWSSPLGCCNWSWMRTMRSVCGSTGGLTPPPTCPTPGPPPTPPHSPYAATTLPSTNTATYVLFILDFYFFYEDRCWLFSLSNEYGYHVVGMFYYYLLYHYRLLKTKLTCCLIVICPIISILENYYSVQQHSCIIIVPNIQ